MITIIAAIFNKHVHVYYRVRLCCRWFFKNMLFSLAYLLIYWEHSKDNTEISCVSFIQLNILHNHGTFVKTKKLTWEQDCYPNYKFHSIRFSTNALFSILYPVQDVMLHFDKDFKHF